MSEPQNLLGIDNVIFHVTDLKEAILFYERCGFKLKFRVDDKGLAIFAIGRERPGLLLRVGSLRGASTLWVEVPDATRSKQYFSDLGLSTVVVETATGLTCEIEDPFGNTIGFADYSWRPDLGRSG